MQCSAVSSTSGNRRGQGWRETSRGGAGGGVNSWELYDKRRTDLAIALTAVFLGLPLFLSCLVLRGKREGGPVSGPG